MTDQRLRDLERRALTDPSAASELLTARLRAGTLTREMMELAAYCGDEAARTASGWLCVCGHAWSAHDDGSCPPRGYLGCLFGWGRGGAAACKCEEKPPAGVTFTGDPLQGAQPLYEWVQGLSRWYGALRLARHAALATIESPRLRAAADHAQDDAHCITCAARVHMDDRPVRDAIRSSLVSWALRDSPS